MYFLSIYIKKNKDKYFKPKISYYYTLLNQLKMDIVELHTPKVLFIKGVFIKDCTTIDDLFDEQIMDQVHDDPVEINIYTPLPTIFYSMKLWPAKTNLRCFYCDMNFEDVPKFAPKTIEPSKEGYTMTTEGCFCTFNCVVSFIDLYYPKIHDNLNKKNMLKLLHKVFTGNAVTEIKKSPSKYNMIQYGGMWTHQEFAKNSPKQF